MLLNMHLFTVCAALIFAVVTAEYQPLTPKSEQRLKSWNENSKESMWQMSGQIEGDMIFTKGQRNGLINTKYRWPNNEILYEFGASVGQEQRDSIVSALKQYEERTCVRTRPKTASDVDYVHITAENTGCWSHVGRIGGMQVLNLQNPGCHPARTIRHEFLHAFGFYHMHSSTERDDYIWINWENIEEGLEYAFDKYEANVISNFGETYDYLSIMHYDKYAFTNNGLETIVPYDSSVVIGVDVDLSANDIARLEKMYECRK